MSLKIIKSVCATLIDGDLCAPIVLCCHSVVQYLITRLEEELIIRYCGSGDYILTELLHIDLFPSEQLSVVGLVLSKILPQCLIWSYRWIDQCTLESIFSERYVA